MNRPAEHLGLPRLMLLGLVEHERRPSRPRTSSLAPNVTEGVPAPPLTRPGDLTARRLGIAVNQTQHGSVIGPAGLMGVRHGHQYEASPANTVEGQTVQIDGEEDQ